MSKSNRSIPLVQTKMNETKSNISVTYSISILFCEQRTSLYFKKQQLIVFDLATPVDCAAGCRRLLFLKS